MDFATIRPALKALAADLTGIDADNVDWADQGGTFGTTVVRMKLRSPTSSGDQMRYEMVDGVLVETARGDRTIVWAVTVESASQEDDGFALYYIERLRNRIKWASSHEALKAALLSIAKIESTVEIPYSDGDHAWSAWQLDIRLNAVASETTDYDGGWIDKVEITSDIDGSVIPIADTFTVYRNGFDSGFDVGFQKQG